MSVPAPLSLARVLSGALRVLWQRRGVFLRGLAFPGIAIVALQVAYWHFDPDWTDAAWASWLVWGVRSLLWIVFAVICHRIVLLDPHAVEVPIFPPWTWRETRFLGWFALVYGLVILVTWVGAMAFVTILLPALLKFTTDAVAVMVPAVAMVFSTYLFSRWAVVFPAAAIDVPGDLKAAWQLTRGNGLRMMVIAGGLPWVLRYASWWLYRDEPTLVEVVLITALGTALIALEIAALSLAYRELSSQATSGS